MRSGLVQRPLTVLKRLTSTDPVLFMVLALIVISALLHRWQCCHTVPPLALVFKVPREVTLLAQSHVSAAISRVGGVQSGDYKGK
jgi:hypothetical protein